MSDAAFREHLAGECTTLCHCWRLTRRDGAVFGFTDHDRPLVVGGQTYEPQSGFTQSEARVSLGMAIDSVDVEGALSSDTLDEADIVAGRYDGAAVETLLVNWQDTAQFTTLRTASVGRITRSDGRFLAELESMAASLDKPNGRHLRRACDARLGDGRCGVAISQGTLRGTGTVVAVSGPATLRVAGLGAYEAGWFSSGEVTWTSGDLAGVTETVVDHRRDGSDLLLVLPASARMPAAGDGFSIVAGCDKQFSTCKAKFGNSLNFRGFPHLPGNDAAYAYVTEGVQFDGGPLVP